MPTIPFTNNVVTWDKVHITITYCFNCRSSTHAIKQL